MHVLVATSAKDTGGASDVPTRAAVQPHRVPPNSVQLTAEASDVLTKAVIAQRGVPPNSASIMEVVPVAWFRVCT